MYSAALLPLPRAYSVPMPDRCLRSELQVHDRLHRAVARDERRARDDVLRAQPVRSPR
jgi:hypothetical protein